MGDHPMLLLHLCWPNYVVLDRSQIVSVIPVSVTI